MSRPMQEPGRAWAAWHAAPGRLMRVPEPTLRALLPSFGRLPVDAYLAAGWRRRRLTRFDCTSTGLRRRAPETVWQSEGNNPYFGGLSRSFEPLEAALLDDQSPAGGALRDLARAFLDRIPPHDPGWTLWVHQLRVEADERGGEPVPEGPHRDERAFVGICVAACEGVEPGVTRLYAKRDGPAIYERTLRPGDMLIFQDEAVFHATAPFAQILGPGAHRDVFLLAVTRSPLEGRPPGEATAP